MLKAKILLKYINFFSPNDYKKNEKITKKMKKLYCVNCSKYKKFEKAKITYLLEKY